jgi:hypothetical protein
MRSLARSVLLPPGSACYRPVAACPKFASDQPRARHAIKGVTRQRGQPGCEQRQWPGRGRCPTGERAAAAACA